MSVDVAPQPVAQYVPIDRVIESPTNPRKHFDPERIKELAASISAHGILQPLVLRPKPGAKGRPDLEIVAGASRFRAAHLVGLPNVPATIRDLGDREVLEIQLVENLQRSDLHPLEEADGYRRLHEAGLDVAAIAARVGRSVKYVYDRIKLLDLTKEAQRLFLAGMITAGHAILLARLSPDEQDRAIGDLEAGLPGGLFTDQRLLALKPEDDYAERSLADQFKAVSVRELQDWIDKHTKVEAAQVDPMLFPETAQVLDAAVAANEKVIRITYEVMTPAEAHGEKVILGRSWKRADGREGSETCTHSLIGMVVIGPGRGEAFRVCTKKDKCTVHWGSEMKARAKHAAAATKESKRTGEDRWAIEERKRQEQEKRDQEKRERWKRATPKILEAVAAAVKKASAKATGQLADLVIAMADKGWGSAKGAGAFVPRGTSAEDLVRHAAFVVLYQEARNEWHGPQSFPARAADFGVDVKKILDEVAPDEPAAVATKKPAQKKPAAKKARKAGKGKRS